MNLCFWLGFIFEVVGVIIALVIAKEQGVRAALRGFAWSALIWLVIVVFLMI